MKKTYRIESEVPMGSPKGMFSGGVRHRFATAFVPRKCHEPGGFGYLLRTGSGQGPLAMPADAAGYNVMGNGDFEWVTWAEIHAMRAERQRAELARKRQPGERWPRRAQLWVFFVEGWLHVGWHVYVRYWSTTERRDGGGRLAYLSSRRFGYNDERVEAELFDLVPMAAGEVAGDYLIPPPVWERVNTWCEAFAKAHPKRKTKTDPRRAGLLNGWTDGRSFFLDRAAAEAGVAAREALWAGKEAA